MASQSLDHTAAALIARRLLAACAMAITAVVTAPATPVTARVPKTIVVTSTGDQMAKNRLPPPGSLREAIERLAEPGDTITFAVSGPVVLKAALRVPFGLTGLTISGPATISGGSRGVLEVLADNATLQGLRFENMNVFGGLDGFDTIGIRVVNNTFAGDSALSMHLVQACHVVENTFTVTGRDDVLAFDRTTGCRIGQNVITGPAAYHIVDESSENLVVDQNRIGGAIWSTSRSGEIRNNTLLGTGRLWVLPSDFPPTGPLRVKDNTAPGIFVQRTHVEITGNSLQPAAGVKSPPPLLGITNWEPRGPAGDVLVERNVLNGGVTGISYTEAATSAPGFIRNNTISNCSGRGLLISGGVSVHAETNLIQDCGTATKGAGIVVSSPTGSGVLVQENTVLGSKGVGISVVNAGDTVMLRGNAVRNSTGAGIEIQQGAGRVVSEGNTVVENAGPGIALRTSARGAVLADRINGNGGAGVLVERDALAAISQVSMHGNAGPGIDIVPLGVTENPQLKRGNLDIDWPEDLVWLPDRLEGLAAPGARVEVYSVEPGPRIGNPQNGEGVTYLGTAIANGAGRFVHPLPCTPGMVLTTTATLPGDQPGTSALARTSEFSKDVTCTLPPPPPVIVSLHLQPVDDLVVGTVRGTGQLVALATDSNGAVRDVTTSAAIGYVSSDATIISVSNAPGTKGQLTAVKAGQVTLTAEIPASEGQPQVVSAPLPARAADPLVMLPTLLPYCAHDQPYTAVVPAIGGMGALTFTLTPESGPLPPGLQLHASTGEITGTCATGGEYLMTFRVQDSSNPAQAATRSFFILVLQLPPQSLPTGRVGDLYPETFIDAVGVVRQGDTRGVYTVVGGMLPPGLMLDDGGGPLSEGRGRISGTPTQAGTFAFTLQVQDQFDGRTDTEQYTIVIEDVAPPTVTMPDLTGRIRSIAEQAILAAGLVVGSVTHQVSAVHAAGTAIGQDPAPGTSVAAGSAVNMTYAATEHDTSVGTFTCYNSPCTQNQEGDITGVNSMLRAPSGVELACSYETGRACHVRYDEVPAAGSPALLCDGGRFDCTATFPDFTTYSCSDQPDCNMVIGRDLLLLSQDPLIPTPAYAFLVITKRPLQFDGTPTDGTFELLLGQDGSPVPASVTTAGGTGEATFMLSLETFRSGEVIAEQIPPGWNLELVTCDRPGFVTILGGSLGPPAVLTQSVAEGAVVHCTFTNRRLPGSTVNPTSVAAPEAAEATGTFGLPPGDRISISGANGFEIVDALTNVIPTAGTRALSFVNTGTVNLYGALVVKHPSGNGSDAIFTHGASGYSVRQFFPAAGDFGAAQVSFPPRNLTDATYFGGDPAASGVLWTNFTSSVVRANVWRDFSGLFFAEANPNLVTSLNVGGATGLISAFAFDLKIGTAGSLLPESTGWVATLVDGAPGQLWISNPAEPFEVGTLVGAVGNGPRRIRCLPSHQICAVSNFGSDSLTIVRWNGQGTASITATQPVGDGPVGISLRADGANVLVISTGFNDSTYTITTIAPDGSVVASLTSPAPAGCVNPGHALWLRNTPDTAVLTCKGSNAYAVIRP